MFYDDWKDAVFNDDTAFSEIRLQEQEVCFQSS